MKIESLAFQNNSPIPLKYTCDGSSINPPLTIADIPSTTQSLVLITNDPDAPSGDFVHWVVFNISPDTSSISEGQTPPGAIVGRNTINQNNYIPPCPPNGQHRYIFKIYALDTLLSLNHAATKKEVEETIKNHIIAQAELIGLYQRQ